MISRLGDIIQNKKVLILGFGREGRSTFRFIRKYFPEIVLGIADGNFQLAGDEISDYDPDLLFLGNQYLDAIQGFDVVIKSPGIKLQGIKPASGNQLWLSQTSVFMAQYAKQIIGISGTKGKSTTASLIYHVLKLAGEDCVLVGNIGQPCFDYVEQIGPETRIVFELSANQLEVLEHSPHISILLNLFPEHLDYFGTVDNYYAAKLNMCRFQSAADFLIYDSQNDELNHRLQKEKTLAHKLSLSDAGTQHGKVLDDVENSHSLNLQLKGKHNLKNASAAIWTFDLLGLSQDAIVAGLQSYTPLEHRLEFVGKYGGINFYNDSISTIPESTIAAVKTVKNTHSLILGGFDRGLDYGQLLDFLAASSVSHFIFTGPAGKRMFNAFEELKKEDQKLYLIKDFNDLPEYMRRTPPGKACVLSPAASSYDQFKDFEERGRAYKKMAENVNASCL